MSFSEEEEETIKRCMVAISRTRKDTIRFPVKEWSLLLQKASYDSIMSGGAGGFLGSMHIRGAGFDGQQVKVLPLLPVSPFWEVVQE